MKLLGSPSVVKVAGLALLLTLILPIDTFGQGRSRRANRGLDKKCEKFVNCHDARDGRWDGRGPRRDDDSIFDRIFRRSRRNRRIDDDDDRRLSRRERWERRQSRNNVYRGRRRY